MAVIIPQVVTEDRANEARAIDGSLKFNSANSHYLNRTPASAGNRRTFTVSFWIKRTVISSAVTEYLFEGGSPDGYSTRLAFRFLTSDAFSVVTGTIGYRVTTQVFRDPSAWYHFVVAFDTTNATAGNRIKIYVNGSEIQSFSTSNNPSQNDDTGWNMAAAHSIGRSHIDSMYGNFYLADFYNIDGQALTPSSFGFTDPLTNTWRPKKYVATTTIIGDTGGSVGFGTNGFYLPFDGNFPIGQNKSGNVGIAWTAVNFGGSNTLEKATGALPILNTVSGGKIASVGVRTDATVGVAATCVLALPLVGVKSDFSYRVDGRSTEKVITAVGNAAASSAQSNFYGGSFVFDGSGDVLYTNSSGLAPGTSDFCCEGWFYYNALPSSSTYRLLGNVNSAANTTDWQLLHQTSGNLAIWNSSSYVSIGAAPISTGSWTHIAYVRDGATHKVYVNGVQVSTTVTRTGHNLTYNGLDIGGRNDGVESFNGYIQDVRFYIGTTKYTQNFIPASTDPDILPDTPSGVSYSSNVSLVPSTDGAVAFDGSGDYLRSTGLDAIGTSDYTIECFLYLDYISGTRQYIWDTRNSSGSSGTYLIKNELNTWYWTPDSTTSNDNSLSLDTIPTNKWTHIAFVRQSGTAKLYVDGILKATLTSHSGNLTSTQATIFAAWDNNVPGKGFISNFHIVNGTALYTANFTPPTAPITSVANTKLLCCKSNSSATTFDVSPGTITANGDAKATNFNPFTVNINTQRGQESGYATLNPLDNPSSCTLSNGNLSFSYTATQSCTRATIGIEINTGKYYWENYITTVGAFTPGIADAATNRNTDYVGESAGSYGLFSISGSAYKYNNNSGSSISGTAYGNGDTVMIAYDSNTGKFYGGCNGIWYNGSDPVAGTNPLYTATSNTYFPAIGGGLAGACAGSINFGQKPFKFPPPAGFQPLALANTPRPTIVRPDQYVNTIIWSGTGGGSGATRSLTGLGFKPDFVWQKARSSGTSHRLLDSVRGSGTGKTLSTNNTNAEGNGGSDESLYGYLSSFDRDGFTLTNGTSTFDNGNKSGDTYVAWAWKAGGNSNTFNINDIGYSTASAAGLTAGTITPTGASINTKSGFSIIAYTGNGVSNATVSHGLGAIPSFAIVKSRSSNSWFIRHNSLDSDKNLNFTSGGMVSPDGSGIVGNLTSSTTFTLKNGSNNTDNINANGTTYIAYLWAEIAGFSKFGKYTGNGSSDGVFVYCGFRPRWILIKVTASTGGADNWRLIDTVRTSYNGDAQQLNANTADLEDTGSGAGYVDINSNGFKIRTTALQLNASGVSIIFAAFAESPQFNLYGGQSNAR